MPLVSALLLFFFSCHYTISWSYQLCKYAGGVAVVTLMLLLDPWLAALIVACVTVLERCMR